ncbi:MAG: hypothetical protein ACNA8O_00065 [Cyanobacteriota bacterium]
MFRVAFRALLLSAACISSAPALAATPLGSDAFVPFTMPMGGGPGADSSGMVTSVETFDPVARAQLLSREIPRSWSGTYEAFDSGQVVPVQLQLASLTPLGQMLDLRGELTIGGVTTPVQGNINAESDQLDLLILCDCKEVAGLELGGSFSGLQGLQLSGWQAPRLTNQGGRLDLRAVGAVATPADRLPQSSTPVRGLW